MSKSGSSKPGSQKSGNRQGRGRRPRTQMKQANLRPGNPNTNDPNWYFTNAMVAEQTAQLSFQEVLGNGYSLEYSKIPTMITIALNPSPGISYTWSGSVGPTSVPVVGGENDGANLMATKIYMLLATYSGRTQSYAPQDVLSMILAISEIAAISEHIRRIFGLYLTMNARNRALPIGMLKALGVGDFDDFQHRIADYRMRFNLQISRINQVPLLDNIGFIRKSRDIFQNVYVDDNSAMAQNWAFVPYSTWILDESSDPRGTVLKTRSCPNNGATNNNKLEDWLQILEDQIDAILTSSTMQLIYSDLINLSSKINIPTWQFDYLAENYVLLPIYSRTAQLQLHNLDLIPAPINLDDYASWDFTHDGGEEGLKSEFIWTSLNDVVHDPDKNRIIYNPLFPLSDRGTNPDPETRDWTAHSVYVDMDTDVPTLEDRIEALRFSANRLPWENVIATRIAGETADKYQKVTYFPTITDRYAVRMRFTTYSGPNVTPEEVWIQSNTIGRGTNQYAVTYPPTKWKDLMNVYSKLTNAPLLYVQDETKHDEVREVIGDLTFPTIVDWHYLQRVNRVIFAGLFDFRTS